jgi:hypothetical protein
MAYDTPSFRAPLDAMSQPMAKDLDRSRPAFLRTAAQAPPHPRRQLPAFGLALLWALAAVSGSSFVLLMDQASNLHLELFGAADSQSEPGDGMDRAHAAALARVVLMRLDDANRTGNYAVFHEMAAPSFKAMNSAADLQRIFAWLRTDQHALSSAAWLGPSSLSPVVMEKGELLHVRGMLPGVPSALTFDLLLQQSNGDWLVFGVALYRG